MNKGISSIFKNTFSHVEDLLKYKPQIGKSYYLKGRKRKIFYLITKQNYDDKPNYSILEASLRHLEHLCYHLDIQKLAMPKIGCGLDQLKWESVERIIHEVFDQSSVCLTVYFRPSVSNITSQSIINDRQIMNPINEQNEVEPTDYIYINIRCKKITEPSRCIVDSFINENPVETLMDTGADSCYIDQHLCPQLNLQVEPYDCEVIFGNQQRLSVFGKVLVTVQIGECEYQIVCKVAETLSYPLILEWDGFLLK
jgi:hypothetical protein